MLRLSDGSPREVTIAQVRRHKNLAIVRFEGIEDARAAELLIGATIVLPREEIVLADDEYFDDDLVGCALVQGDRRIGVVRAVLHYPAQDILQLESGALVPLVRAFIREIAPARKIIRVELPAGLVEGEPEEA
jgi:16S rRNA processing protein RimM